MKRKPRILAVGEFSLLSTGYSTYNYEVLSRLYKAGKYELAELACYVSETDPRISQLPWKVFVNHPNPNNPEAVKEFESKISNQFGGYKFEEVCLEFQPDIVWDIRDPWVVGFEEYSPFREFFRWVYMTTLDSSKQQEQWISTYINADAVLAYNDWSTDILNKECGYSANVMGTASPGADLVNFHPMDKKQLRTKFGFENNEFIVGTVMRNQPRKLYPELIEAFELFQKKADPALAKKTYLYLHTSYPDLGWDIPKLIKESSVSRKILVTYKCKQCNVVFPSVFMDAICPCLKCGELTAILPNVNMGIDRANLAKIINLFDVYVQYSNSEGFGMPMVEAASCGVPVMGTDYSAMSDVVRKLKGFPIPVNRYYRDADLGCVRANPSNEKFVEALIRFLELPESEKFNKARQARFAVEEYYTWEKTAKKWDTVFTTLLESPTARTWSDTPLIKLPDLNPPQLNSNEEIVHWAILNVLSMPQLLNSYMSARLIRDLNYGMTVKTSFNGMYGSDNSFRFTQGNTKAFTVKNLIEELALMRLNINSWEEKRYAKLNKND